MALSVPVHTNAARAIDSNRTCERDKSLGNYLVRAPIGNLALPFSATLHSAVRTHSWRSRDVGDLIVMIRAKVDANRRPVEMLNPPRDHNEGTSRCGRDDPCDHGWSRRSLRVNPLRVELENKENA